VHSSQQHKLRVNSARCPKISGLRQGHPAPDGGVINPCKVYGRALTGGCLCNSLSTGLHTPNAKPLTTGQEFHFIASLHSAGDQRAGYDCSKAFHREHSIDWQTKRSRGVLGADLGRSVMQGQF
jgi:hypothetical protein